MNTEPSLLRSLESHRSIRRFKPEPIPPADVERMMCLAQRASTGGAGQLYSIIRVTDDGLRNRMAEITGQAHVATAAEFFVGSLQRVLDELIALLQLPEGV
ncbi:MAG: nitroreductase family protein [Chloroflexi bacterium]|nr:nitroreductase family protein [Chloroflexota bacterium]